MPLRHEYVEKLGPVVVCDTNIWYKNIPDELKSKYNFAATWYSIYELIKASKRKPGVLISTWERLRDSSSYIIPFSFEQYFHFCLNNGEIINREEFTDRQTSTSQYDNIITLKKNGRLSDDHWDEFECQVAAFRNKFNANVSGWIDQVINSYRRDHPLTQDKIDFLTDPEGIRAHLFQVTIPLIIYWMDYNKKVDTHDFSKFELFTLVLNQWIIDLDLGVAVAKVNDLIDVFNMMFVAPEDLYWTEEKQWINRIKKVGLERYLFNPNQ